MAVYLTVDCPSQCPLRIEQSCRAKLGLRCPSPRCPLHHGNVVVSKNWPSETLTEKEEF